MKEITSQLLYDYLKYEKNIDNPKITKFQLTGRDGLYIVEFDRDDKHDYLLLDTFFILLISFIILSCFIISIWS